MRPRLHTIFTNANSPTDPSQFCGNKSPCRTRPVLNVKFSAARYPCTRINQPWTENTKLIRYLQKWLTAAPRFSAGETRQLKTGHGRDSCERSWSGLSETDVRFDLKKWCHQNSTRCCITPHSSPKASTIQLLKWNLSRVFSLVPSERMPRDDGVSFAPNAVNAVKTDWCSNLTTIITAG